MSDTVISLHDFMIKCQKKERYIGNVLGLGYVSAWRTERISMDRPINNPNAFVGNAQFSHTIDVPVITSTYQNSKYTDMGKGASWGGVAATAGTIIDMAILMEPKYIRINPQGTMMRNPNFGKTKLGTKGIFGGLGGFLFGYYIYCDIKAHSNREISLVEMFIDIGINGAIYRIGSKCPILGVVLGVLYMGITASRIHYGTGASYEEIHGSVTPGDHIKVNIPQEESPYRKPYPTRETPVLNQGRR